MPALQKFHYLFLSMFLLLAAACQPSQPVVQEELAASLASSLVQGTRRYAVELVLEVKNLGPGSPTKHNLWLALIRDFPNYQQVVERSITPADFQLVVDELGNQYAEFDLDGLQAGETRLLRFSYLVQVNELTYDLGGCQGDLPDFFTQPELHIESANPQIVSLSQQLSQGSETPCQQLRSFYDYVAGHLVYSFNGRNWGAQAALGPMGADCTEYTSLLVALSRAQGIPARYFEGLLYLEGSQESLGRVEHAWADAFMPGVGWVPFDPTLGRSSVNRETYFARYEPNHIILTVGASPSTLRGSSYWTHLYWPGDSAEIHLETDGWSIQLLSK